MSAILPQPTSRPLIVPSCVVTALATTTMQQIDDVLRVIARLGEWAGKLKCTELLDDVGPMLVRIAAHIDTYQTVLKAVLEENSPERTPQ